MTFLPRHREFFRQPRVEPKVARLTTPVTVAALARIRRAIALVSSRRVREQVGHTALSAVCIRGRVDLGQSGTVASDVPVGLPTRIIKEPVDRVTSVEPVNSAQLP